MKVSSVPTIGEPLNEAETLLLGRAGERIVKLWLTGVAGRNSALPSWLAVTRQLPAFFIVNSSPFVVQMVEGDAA